MEFRNNFSNRNIDYLTIQQKKREEEKKLIEFMEKNITNKNDDQDMKKKIQQ